MKDLAVNIPTLLVRTHNVFFKNIRFCLFLVSILYSTAQVSANCDLSTLGAAGVYDISTVSSSFSGCTDTLTVPSGYTLLFDSGTAFPSGVSVLVVESGGIINVNFDYVFPNTLLKIILKDPDGDGGSPSGALDFDGNQQITISSFTQLVIENIVTLTGDPGAAIIGMCSQQVLIFIDSNPYAGCQNPNGQGVCFSFDQVIQAGGSPLFEVDGGITGTGSASGNNVCVDSDFQLSASISVTGSANQFVNPATFVWTQISGPGTVTFNDTTIFNPTASADIEGEYIIRVTGTQNLSIQNCVSLVDVILIAEITITILPNIMATISAGIDVCQNDMPNPSLTVTNTLPNDIIVFYSINGGPAQSVSVLASNTNTISQSTAIADTFIYSLDSARYVIDPVCTSFLSQKDTVIIHPTPTISGIFEACIGFTSQLSGTPINGSWLSLDPLIASVDANGLVTGESIGMVDIEYTSPEGCKDTIIFDVNTNGVLSLQCPSNILSNNDSGNCSSSITIPTVIFGNPCSPSSLNWYADGATLIGSNFSESGQPNIQTFNTGITTIYLKATDDNSGEENCSFTITISDNENPTISTCPVNRDFTGCNTSAIFGPTFSTTSILSSYSVFSDLNNQGDASDNCGIDSVYYVDIITSAPNDCPISVSRTWTLKDSSNNEVECIQTLTITPPTILVTEAESISVAACQTQEQINTAFASWLGNFSISGGCSATFSTSPAAPVAPDSCGGMAIVTWTVSNGCYASSTHIDTFTVIDATPIIVTEAGSVEQNSCQTQTDINNAFASWLGNFSISGGCSATFSTSPAIPVAPDSCGGMTIVTWTVSADHCYNPTTHIDTFTVIDATPIIVTEAGSVEQNSCQTQTDINNAFASWLGNFSISGGCSATFSTSPAIPVAPDSCGGMTIVTWTVSADHCYNPTTHIDTFTVIDATPIIVTEAGSVEQNSCQTQTDINNAFASWLGNFSISGGCSATFSTSPAIPVAPDSCGGMTIVTWTVSADHCYNPTTHIDTFTVIDATPIIVTEAGSVEQNSCQTQTDINNAFASWLGNFSISGGCSATFSTSPAIPVAPDSCGGMTIVTWTVSADHCYNPTTHIDTFTVIDATPIIVTEAGSVEQNSCQTQTDINNAFASWLGNFSISGGCSATFSTSPAIPVAPDSCGGMTIVTWTVSADHCYNPTTHIDTFTVIDATPIIVTEAGSVEQNSCQTQTDINNAFASWLGNFSISGGCSATFSTSPAIPVAPDSCGGMTIVTWTVSADHCYNPTTHIDTFTVIDATPIIVTEAGSVEQNSCQTQTDINNAFASWLGNFSISGGCSATFSTSPAIPVAPDSCGGMTIVTWTVSADHCYNPTTHIDTFTVIDATPIIVTEAGSVEQNSCQTQTDINNAFASWLGNFSISGGCSATFSTSPAIPVAPDSCGGMTIVTWTVSADHCYNPTTHIDTFTVIDATPIIVTEAGSVEQNSCQTQTDINNAFASWLGNFSISGGCSATFSTSPAIPVAPDSCGGMTIVTWTVSADHCYNPTTHIDTFTVIDATPIIVTEAGSVEQNSCQTQTDINNAFASWLGNFSISGGCSATFSTSPAIPVAPDSCGGMTIVTWTVSADHCYNPTTHIDTFTVIDATPIIVTEAGSVEQNSCQTQTDINNAFASWLGNFSISGGCSATFSTSPAIPVAPDSCGGMTIVTWTVSADHCYNPTTHIDTFTVIDATPIIVTEAGSVEQNSCQTQTDINNAFASWLGNFSISGGCSATFSTSPAIPVAPDSCGGMTIVTWTVSADHCYNPTTHIDTFTVIDATPIIVTEAGSVEQNSCQTQTDINNAFASWLGNFSISGGCSATFSTSPAIPVAPDSCGGMTIVTWTVSADHCYNPTTHIDTFTVIDATPIIVTEAGSVEQNSCQTQTDINNAFASWLGNFSISGGCSATFSTSPAIPVAPDSCGGMTIVTWTVSADHCYNPTTHIDTFTVIDATPIIVTEAGSVEQNSCQTQTDINNAFASWLGNFSISGGCSATFSTSPAIPVAPDSCGGMTIVTWTVSADHCYNPTTHIDTFTVIDATPIIVTEAGSVEQNSCQTQTDINNAFASWLGNFSISGGCSATFSTSPAIPVAPDSCGGMTIVTWTVSADHCYNPTTHIDTFTVIDATPIIVTEAGSVEQNSCQTQTDINNAFASWLGNFSISGGCSATFSTSPAIPVAPDSCGGMTIVTWTVSADHCYNPTTHIDTFTVIDATPIIVTEAGSVEQNSCQTQTDINNAFASWLGNFSISGGCSATFSTSPAIPVAPDSCGGMTIVTWTVSADHCYNPTTHIDTFTVIDATPIIVTEAGSVEQNSCQTQTDINNAFASWLGNFSISGGCSATFSTSPAIPVAPDSCGGMTIVTWTVSADHCYNPTTHIDTFTVIDATPIIVTEAGSVEQNSCQTQTDINNAFASWLGNFSISGGCSATFSTSPAIPVAPDSCGGMTIVTWTVSADHCYNPTTHIDTFTVIDATPIIVTEAGSVEQNSCQTQTDINNAFASWLGNFSISGGCSATFSTSPAIPVAPDSCGGMTIVTWTVSADHCYNPTTHIDTFTVIDATPIIVTEAGSVEQNSCQTQTDINNAFASWLGNFSISGGCSATFSTSPAIPVAPDSCGGMTIVTWTVSADHCYNPTTHIDTFTVIDATPIIVTEAGSVEQNSCQTQTDINNAFASWLGNFSISGGCSATFSTSPAIPVAPDSCGGMTIVTWTVSADHCYNPTTHIDTFTVIDATPIIVTEAGSVEQNSCQTQTDINNAFASWLGNFSISGGCSATFSTSPAIPVAPDSCGGMTIVTWTVSADHCYNPTTHIDTFTVIDATPIIVTEAGSVEQNSCQTQTDINNAFASWLGNFSISGGCSATFSTSPAIPVAPDSCGGMTIVTWTVSADHCYNPTTHIDTFTVIDATPIIVTEAGSVEQNSCQTQTDINNAFASWLGNFSISGGCSATFSTSPAIPVAPDSCGGMTIVTWTVSADHCYNPTTHIDTFTVIDATPIIVTEAGSVEQNSCQTQTDINNAFASWLGNFSISGGCSATFSTSPAIPVAPDSCGGMTIVTWTVSADHCYNPTTHIDTFTVIDATPIIVTEAGSVEQNSCQTQTDINNAFASWLGNFSISGGCSATFSTSPAIPVAPDSCGGMTIVTWTVSADHCYNPTTHIDTFTVIDATPIIVTEAGSVEQNSCQTQTDINNAFASWLGNFSISGGCSATFSTSPAIPVAPDSCGGMTIVTWTVSADHCYNPTTHIDTFTVIDATPIIVTEAGSVEQNSCQTQTDINNAFASWLGNFSISGGCSATFSTSPAIPVAPDSCGGMTIVTWTVSADHCYNPTTHIDTFTVIDATPIIVTEAGSVEQNSCQTQTDINNAFASWLGNFSISGGCSATFSTSPAIPVAPDSCGGMTIVTWTVSADHCYNPTTHIDTFTVIDATPIIVTEAGSVEQNSCQTQTDINNAFASWLGNFSISGGCSATFSTSPAIPVAPDSCGGMTIVTWTVSADHCYNPTTHIDTFTVIDATPIIVTEAGSVEQNSCQTQTDINNAFASWLGNFSISGGCSATFSTSPAIPVAPDSCGGMTIVTWTVSADHCYNPTTHIDTFTVIDATPIIVTEAGSVEQNSCQTQTDINNAFASWLGNFSISGGCSATFSTSPAIPVAPDSCGGMTIVTWTVSADHCYNPTTHIDTFTVIDATPIIVTEAGSVEQNSCQTQTDINNAFASWLGNFSISGGCSATFSTSPAIPVAPDSCGGMTIVTWTVSADHCYNPTTHIDTFTVIDATPIIVTEAGSVEQNSCQTQTDINNAFASWLGNFSISGGCSATFSTSPAIPVAPDSCGGMTIVTWTVSADHCYNPTTHIDTFTVIDATPIIVTEAGSVEQNSCQTQTDINNAFASWLGNFSISGGCSATFSTSPAIPVAPDSCGGMTIVTWTVSADHCYNPTTHIDTFTVIDATPIIVTEAGSVEQNSCQTQTDINNAFASWLGNFSISGGCSATFSTSPAIPVAPDSCGGMTIVTWTVSADHCYNPTTHIDTFTVIDATPIIVTEAGSVEQNSCQTQTDINNAFASWLGNFSISGGCSATFSTSPAIPVAPDSCGGMTIVTWTVSADHCYNPTTHIDTFTVIDATPIIVTEAGSVEQNSCQTQTDINNAFASWLGNFSISGGCSATFSTSPAIPVAPDSCGGMTIVTWTVSADHCYNPTTHIDTFTVIDATPIIVTEAGSVEQNSCQTQTDINNAFASWLGNFSISGGCSATFSTSPAIPVAPDSCGGMTIVTWTVSADHCYNPTTHIDTFTVIDATPIIVTEAGSVEENSCQTQTDINNAFASWLGNFSISGGCSATFSTSPAIPVAPDSCGGMTIVTWTVSADHCYNPTTHIDTFTVIDATPIIVTEAGSVEENSCQTQTDINNAFASWLGNFSISGGCSATFSTSPAIPVAPDSCGGMTIVTWTVSADHCYNPTTHIDTFTVIDATPIIVTEAGSVEQNSCQTQTDINNAFASWLGNFSISGGCSATFSTSPAIPVAPDSCGGMTIVTWTVSADHCYNPTTHIDTFTVIDATPIIVTEAGSVEENSCQTQTDINNAFASWLGNFSISGGCSATFSTSPAIPVAPDSCGGMTIVTWTVSADHCYNPTTHIDTFTVIDATPIIVTEAGSVEQNSCQTQTDINNAFASWLGNFSISGGCSATFSTSPAIPVAPDSCGGMTIVTWTVSADHCYNPTTHIDTFTVIDATPIIVTEAGSVEENSCQTQTDINNAFASWLGNFSISGGCSATFSTSPAIPVAPDSCGGMTIVTWTVSADHCYNPTTHIDTFTVIDATPIIVTEAGSVEQNSCQTQTDINNAFASWLGNFSISGGCSATFSTSPAIPVAPDSCGGMTIVTWTVSADHCYNPTTHIDTFTVIDATPIIVTEAGSVEQNSCQTQTDINNAFASWLGNFSISGGCSATFSTSPAIPVAPDSCGGMTIVTWTVSADHCYNPTTHIDTFTVIDATPIIVTEAGSVEQNSCQTQTDINNAFASWLGNFSISGGCSATFSTSPAIPVAPDSCGGMTIVTWTVSADHCYNPTTHIDTFTVIDATPIIVTEAGSVEQNSCQTQTDINNVFASWLGNFSISGGCSATFSTSPAIPVAPDSCGGMTIVTWTVSADHCYNPTTHIDTFTVIDATPIIVTEAGSVEQNSCQTQTDINNAFASWLGNFSISGGCSATFSTSPAIPVAPDSCGGMTIVTWTVSADHCYNPTTHVDTFTVIDATPIIVTEAGSVEQNSCQTQTDINNAFASWLGNFSISGGCSATFSTSPAIPVAPDSCGGMTIVTWTVSADHCYNPTTHIDTFTVIDATPIIVTEAGSVEENSCQTQTDINNAFASWLGNFSISGSCSATFSTSPAIPVAPDSCGGMTIVTWTVSADHCYNPTTHIDTFTVIDATPIIVTEAGSVEENSCQTQTDINNAFASWLGNFSISGGCSATFSTSPAIPVAPDSCGGMTIVTWTVSADHCYNPTTHIDTFTVIDATPIIVTEAGSVEENSCQTQTDINNAFASWLGNFSISGGCSATFSTSPAIPVAPDSCGGMTIVTWTVSADHCYNPTTHIDTFTVIDATPIIVTEAGSVEQNSCQTQTDINNVFASWLGNFSISGGCSATFSTSPAIPVAPDSCGGMTIVTWTVSADHCYNPTTHIDTFTVIDATPIIVTEAGSVEQNSCQTQTDINNAFASWLGNFSISGGCSATFSTSPAIPVAPDSCGGMTIVTWTVSADHCYNPTTHVDTFTVIDATPIIVTEAGSVEQNSCQTQTDINNAFASWLGNFSISGGCSATFSTSPAIPVAPDSCGGMTIVTWTVSADHCYNPTTHIDTFTVIDATPIIVTEAGSVEENSCQTQTDINNAFASWLGNFSISGSCSATFSTSPAIPVAPDSCGGMTIVTWTVSADHCYNPTTHIDTFTVIDATPIIVTEAGSVEENSCQTQTDINNAFASWLGNFSISGGCSATFSTSPAIPVAPDSCGGMTIVTWTVSADHCYNPTTHIDTFTVIDATPIIVTEAGSVEQNSCQTQTDINNAFASWLGNFSISGGCSATFSTSPAIPVAPDSCGGMTIVTWTVSADHCYNPTTHIDTFTVFTAPEIVWVGDKPINQIIPTTDNTCDTLVTFMVGDILDECNQANIEYNVTVLDTSGSNISVTHLSGLNYEALFPGGINEIFITATGSCGSMLLDTFTIQITDEIGPTAVCPSDTLIVQIGIDETGVLQENALAAGNSTDNCQLTEFSPEVTYTCDDLGIHFVNLIATDVNDNVDTAQCPVKVIGGTNCPVNLTPNFFPPQAAILDLGDVKDFVIKVDNTLNGTTEGIIQVFIPYQVGFSFVFIDNATTASTLFGPWPIENTSWDQTILQSGILLTAKAGVTIGSFGSLNFSIQVTADNGGSSGSITANISPTSGGQTDNTDDTKSRNININN